MDNRNTDPVKDFHRQLSQQLSPARQACLDKAINEFIGLAELTAGETHLPTVLITPSASVEIHNVLSDSREPYLVLHFENGVVEIWHVKREFHSLNPECSLRLHGKSGRSVIACAEESGHAIFRIPANRAISSQNQVASGEAIASEMIRSMFSCR